jgi:hypothetical protein
MLKMRLFLLIEVIRLMSRQVYFSLVIVALSFITVKSLQEAGIHRYRFFRDFIQIQNGWYNLNDEGSIEHLPFGVNHIAGLTSLTGNQLCFYQEKNGTISIYDLKGDSLINQITIGDLGTCLSLVQYDSTFYMLTDQAQLHEIHPPIEENPVATIDLMLPQEEILSMCLDKRDNQFLLCSSSRTPGDKGNILHTVYSLALQAGAEELEPLFTIEAQEIESFVNAQNQSSKNHMLYGKVDSLCHLNFEPKSIAVHPKSNEIYILSPNDRAITVCNKAGEVINFIALNDKKCSNPGKLTFLQNGDLIITNEGPTALPSLVRFNWNRYKNPAD